MMKTSNFKIQDSEKLQDSTLKRMAKFGVWSLVLLWSLNIGVWSFAAGAPLYTNNFESAQLDQVPEDMLVLDGNFAIKQENGNKFLELPGAPLDTFGVLFGPTTNSQVAVTARIYGTAKGRRYPTFGVGLNGAGGYKLMVVPSKNKLELYKGDNVMASSSMKWKSGTWSQLRLEVHTADGKWLVEGNYSYTEEGKREGWGISFIEKTEPTPGRASISGSPYSGTPIRYDDLAVLPLGR